VIQNRRLHYFTFAKKHFTGARTHLVMNCCMIRRALAVATGLVAVCFPVAGQQANQPEPTKDRAAAFEQSYAAGALDRAFALSLYQPKILSAKKSSLLFNKGRVLAWSDGGQLASENALASIGMASLNLFSDAYFVPDTFGSAPARKGSAPSGSGSENFGSDAKDLPGELMASPSDLIYYGGEIGFLYGHSIGKGSGDMLQSYIWGQAGNDKFQITAGAAFENWSGQAPRFRSFNVSR
jgi:hypothetical protein